MARRSQPPGRNRRGGAFPLRTFVPRPVGATLVVARQGSDVRQSRDGTSPSPTFLPRPRRGDPCGRPSRMRCPAGADGTSPSPTFLPRPRRDHVSGSTGRASRTESRRHRRRCGSVCIGGERRWLPRNWSSWRRTAWSRTPLPVLRLAAGRWTAWSFARSTGAPDRRRPTSRAGLAAHRPRGRSATVPDRRHVAPRQAPAARVRRSRRGNRRTPAPRCADRRLPR